MIDYHTHTYRCGHAAGTAEEYVQRGAGLGLREIGLSDHFFQYFLPSDQRDPQWAMAEEDFAAHYAEICAVRDQHRSGFTVRVAVEIDYLPGREDDLKHALEPFDFDYVLGGIHFLDDWMIDDQSEAGRYETADLYEVYQKYYAAMQEGVSMRAFDIVAHFDLPKKFGFHAPPEADAIVRKTLDAIRDQGLAIEVSTAGLRKPVRELYPALGILREIRRRHIPVVLGSDAHDPSEVGHEFEQAIALLKDLGFHHLASYERRRQRPIALS